MFQAIQTCIFMTFWEDISLDGPPSAMTSSLQQQQEKRENDKLLTAINSTAGTLTLPPGLIFRVYSATCGWMRDFHTPVRLFYCITYVKN